MMTCDGILNSVSVSSPWICGFVLPLVGYQARITFVLPSQDHLCPIKPGSLLSYQVRLLIHCPSMETVSTDMNYNFKHLGSSHLQRKECRAKLDSVVKPNLKAHEQNMRHDSFYNVQWIYPEHSLPCSVVFFRW